ncbi:hypothetical protein PUN28_018070 [Cardiocondyla obscurior]|uniref:Uncharacterized protein n=1 Tax=Cardiocondyla obscurior TaxID=286306 RepID=A0AAW2EK69_9HYME
MFIENIRNNRRSAGRCKHTHALILPRRSTAEFAGQTGSFRPPPARPPPCELGFLEREGCQMLIHAHI